MFLLIAKFSVIEGDTTTMALSAPICPRCNSHHLMAPTQVFGKINVRIISVFSIYQRVCEASPHKRRLKCDTISVQGG